MEELKQIWIKAQKEWEELRWLYLNEKIDDIPNMSDYILGKVYEAGYRKQSEGEWIDSLKGYGQCSNCRTSFETLPTTFMFKLNNTFCRHCGAKMSGGKTDE